MSAEPEFLRTIVYVRKDRTQMFQPARFDVCLMDYFGIHDDFGRLECYLKDNIVFLQPPPPSTAAGSQYQKPRGNIVSREPAFRFQHPSFCVAHKISKEEKEALPPDLLSRGVDVGVCMLLESKDGHILVTRRAPHMRTFPGVWVPPGGHIEEGETFVDVGVRELMEETGLLLEPHEYENHRVLGLWESVYPPVLYMGQPKRHHLVVYLHLKLEQTKDELQRRLQLDYSEVDASIWLNKKMTEIVVYGSNSKPTEDIPITLVNREGEHTEGRLNPKALRKKMPEPGLEVERMTTGTRYALKLWLQDKLRTEEEDEDEESKQRNVESAHRPFRHTSEVSHLSVHLKQKSSALSPRLYTPMPSVNEVEIDS